MDLSSLSFSNIFAGILFGTIGFSAFMYGKKQTNIKAVAIGIVLMVCPYIVPNTIAVYIIGVVLTAALFF